MKYNKDYSGYFDYFDPGQRRLRQIDLNLSIRIEGTEDVVPLTIKDHTREIVRMMAFSLAKELQKIGYRYASGLDIEEDILFFLRNHFPSVHMLSTYNIHEGLDSMLGEYVKAVEKSPKTFPQPKESLRFKGFLDEES